MADTTTDQDEAVYASAKDSAYALDMQYRKAVREEDWDKADALKLHVDAAYARVSDARTALIISPGTLASDDDVQEMKDIEASINNAASTQQLIVGAVALVSFLGKFV